MRARLIIIPAAVAVGAALATAPLVITRLGLDQATRLVPSQNGWLGILWLAAWAAPVVHLLLLATVGQRALASLRRRRRWIYVGTTSLLQVGVTIGSLAAGVNSNPHLFGGDLIATVPSPDRSRVGYLYTGGLVCGYDVFVAEAGANTMHNVKSVAMTCRPTTGSTLVWSDDATLTIHDARGPFTGPFSAERR